MDGTIAMTLKLIQKTWRLLKIRLTSACTYTYVKKTIRVECIETRRGLVKRRTSRAPEQPFIFFLRERGMASTNACRALRWKFLDVGHLSN